MTLISISQKGNRSSLVSFGVPFRSYLLALFSLWAVLVSPRSASAVVFETVHSFSLGPQKPESGELLRHTDGNFYGVTSSGGAWGCGTIYKLTPAGEVTTLVQFSRNGATNKGASPQSRLVSDGSGNFWGTTSDGGAGNYGTVFRVNSSTGALTTVIEFTSNGATNKGASPRAGLISDGSGNLWGTTSYGGANGYGTVLRINASNGALTTLVEFSNNGASNKGAYPQSGLVSDGSGNFWGTTAQGGTNNYGTVFRINASTGALTTVVEFSNNGTTNKGAYTQAGLVSDGSGNFWGTTYRGGASDYGTVFRVNASTGALTTVVQFTNNGATNKGAYPRAGLISDGNGNFWGTTYTGGANDYGTVFRVNASTGALTTLVQFTNNGATNKGGNPYAGLVSDGNGNFWGTTPDGGANGNGTVFRVNASTGSLTTVVDFTSNSATNEGAYPDGGLISDGSSNFWGTTSEGGALGYGTIFRVNASTSALTTVVEFTDEGAINKGASPFAGLVSDGNGNFWGTTYTGGPNGYGTVFRVNASTGALTTVVQFTSNGAANKGAYPIARLISDGNGNLWGTTSYGGASDWGTVFRINASTGVLTTVVQFTNNGATNKGALPYAELVSDGSGNLWGTTVSGGANDYGTVFRINASTGVLTTLVQFTNNGATNKGSSPIAGLASDGNGSFWGMTSSGGTKGYGTIYRVNASTGALTTVVEFTDNGASNKGSSPQATLVSDGSGNFWGTTLRGGANTCGTVFRINASTGVLTTLFSLNLFDSPAPGAGPRFGNLLFHSDGNSYGTTRGGGVMPDGSPAGGGTIFRLRFGPTPKTLPTSNLAAYSARLNGTVNPNSQATTAWFERRLAGSNATFDAAGSTPPQSLGNGSTVTTIFADVNGLAPNTSYEYRLVARNAENTVDQIGEIITFTTPSDTATELPTLLAPVNNTVTKSPISVSYTLPEAAAANSVQLVFAGTSTYTLTLASIRQTADTHTFTLNPASPVSTNVSSISGGSAIPDGTYTVTLRYQDTAGNPAATAIATNVRIDTTGPVLSPVSIASNGVNPTYAKAGNTISVTFTANETLQTPVVTIHGSAATVSQVSGNTWKGSVSVNAGTTNGTVSFSISAQDSTGNPRTVSAVTDGSAVTVDTVAPVLELPEDLTEEAADANGKEVNFSAAAHDTGGSGVETLTFQPLLGSVFPLGITTVTATATDHAGNTATGTFTITVQDQTAPTASAPPITLTAGPNGTVLLGDQRSVVTASDAITPQASLIIEQTPDAATELPLGSHPVSFKVSDAAGNFATVNTTATVSFAPPAGDVAEVRSLATSGTLAPTTPGLPTGTLLTSFAAPAVSDFRDLASRVVLTAGKSKLAGIYVVDGAGTGRIPAFQTGPVPGPDGAALTGLSFKTFLDPVLSPNGSIAFSATIMKAKSTEDQGVWTDAFGPLALVLREGSGVPELPEATLKSVTSLSLQDGSLVALIKLNAKKNVVVSGKDDVALVELTGVDTGKVLLRTGADFAGSKIKTIATLAPALGSPGHGRWHGKGAVLAKVTLLNKDVQLVVIEPDGTQTPLLSSLAAATPIASTAVWKSFGVPVMGCSGFEFAVSTILAQKFGGVTSKNDVALIFSQDGTDWQVFAREGDLTPISSASDGPRYVTFFDPVTNEAGHVAYLATVAGLGVTSKNKTVLFAGPPDAPEVTARLGAFAPNEEGAPTAAVWTKFISHSLSDTPGAGVIFLADTSGGDTTSKNKLGLWAVDQTGQLRRVLRNGTPIVQNGPLLTTFTLLTALPGSYGTTRSFNQTGSVTVLATFANKTQQILRIDLP